MTRKEISNRIKEFSVLVNELKNDKSLDYILDNNLSLSEAKNNPDAESNIGLEDSFILTRLFVELEKHLNKVDEVMNKLHGNGNGRLANMRSGIV